MIGRAVLRAAGTLAAAAWWSVVAAQGLAPAPVDLDDPAALLARPQRCSFNGLAIDLGAVRLDAVLRSVICGYAPVRRAEGLNLQAQAGVEQARAAAWPTVSVSATADAERGSSVGRGAAVGLQWVLFDFGRRDAELAQASQALAAALDEQRVEVLNAVGQAAQLYAAAQAAVGRLDAATINLRTASDSARVAEARLGVGASTLNSVLQVRTALAQAQLERSRATGQWLSARGALAVAMRLAVSAPLELASDVSAEDGVAQAAVVVDALMDEARTHHPRVRAARARLAQAQARADAVRAERWGRVSLTASGGRRRPSDGSAVESTGAAQLTWSVQVFDGGLFAARANDALGRVQVEQATLDEALGQVELQVWQQAQALIGEQAARRDSKAVLASAEQALRVATERFRLGVGSLTDVLSAQTTTAQARFQWAESQATLRREQMRLAAAVGRFGSLLRF